MNFEVYCDESRQEYFWTKADSPHNRYVLIGSLWLESSQRAQIKAEIKALRAKHSLFGEFKWKRVSPSRQQFYVDLIDLFFHSSMRFRAIVLPANQLNVIQFHNADNELMFYKFYYQLLHHWILDFNTYRIFVDAKTNRVRERPAHLRRILDQGRTGGSGCGTICGVGSKQEETKPRTTGGVSLSKLCSHTPNEYKTEASHIHHRLCGGSNDHR